MDVSVSLSSKPSNDKFLGAKLDGTVKPEWEVAYWFNEYPNEVRLCAKTKASPEPKKEDVSKAERAKEKEDRARTVEAMKHAFREFEDKRRFYVYNITPDEAEKIFGIFMGLAVEYWAVNDGCGGFNEEMMQEVLGDWFGDEEEIDGEMLATVCRDAERHPVQTALWLMYSSIEDDISNAHPFVVWQNDDGHVELNLGDYKGARNLKKAYNLLEAIGYEVEPYERALLDGTSPMYYANGGKSLEEAKAGTATAPDDTTEMSRFEALKALPREQLAKYLAAFDKGRAPDGMAEMLDLIGECDSVEALVHKISDWFCCDIPCPVDENGDDVSCEVCIDMWLRQKKKWGFKTLMKEVEDS